MEIRNPDAKLIEERPLALTPELLGPPPGFGQRHFSLKKRLTRLDFLWSLLLCLAVYPLEVILRIKGQVGWSLMLLLVSVGYLALAATKRCRDADLNPWWAVPSLVFTPGLLVLLFDGGSVGPNRFGPDPRGRRGEMNQPIQPDAENRPSSGASSATEDPSSLGPRG